MGIRCRHHFALFSPLPFSCLWGEGAVLLHVVSGLVEVSAPISLDFLPLANPPMAALLLGLFLPNFVPFSVRISGGQGYRLYSFLLLL